MQAWFMAIEETEGQEDAAMNFVPRAATDEQVLNIVRGWVDVLSKADYKAVFDEIGLSIRGEAPGAECIQGCIQYYRSPEYYPGVEEFIVTDWRTAQGGNPEPMLKVEWYEPNSIKMAGAVSFDLPLNGRWSDLTADFVFFENDCPEGYNLCLEEINSWVQGQRDSWEQDQRDIAAMGVELSSAEALEQEHLDVQLIDAQPSASSQTSRFDIAGEHLSQKQDVGAALYNDEVSR